MAEKNNSRGNAGVIDPRPGGRGGGPMSARINVEHSKNPKKTLLRLIKYIGKSKITIVALILLTLAAGIIDLQGPRFQKEALDTITVENGSLDVDFEVSKLALVKMIVFFVSGAALTLVQERIARRLSVNTVYHMRRELFEKIAKLPIKYTDTHRHGDIMSRMTNDIDNVSAAISQSLTALVSALVTVIGAVILMLRYSIAVTLVAMITIPLTIIVSSKLAKFMRKYFIRQQKLLGQLNGQVEETVTGYSTVVSYGKEPASVEKFTEISEEFRRCSISARVWGSIMGPVMNFIGNLQYVLVAGLGGYIMIRGVAQEGTFLWVFFGGAMTVGTIQAMLQYSKKLSRPINMIANQYSSILTALAGAERIFEIFDTPDETNEGNDEVDVEKIKGYIDFTDIDFSYTQGEPVLKKLSLSIKPGQKIAIVGATGSGKTTIVNLLTRFYELDGGKITIDDKDITEFPKETLRRAIAIVLQDTVLFSDTIKNNIKYGRLDASDDEVERAAKMAHANGFIERLPDGYDTMLAESGSNLSEGQRQLLAIARAVLADPKILILDEATSSVDTQTEMHIQDAMTELMKNRTSLIIAHRLSTIRNADVIVVLSHGEIVESGNHSELLALGGEYSKLYASQFAGIST